MENKANNKKIITINTNTEDLINKIKAMQNTKTTEQKEKVLREKEEQEEVFAGEDVEEVFIGEDVKVDFMLDQDLTKYLVSIMLGEKATPEQIKQIRQKAAETVYLSDHFVIAIEAQDSPSAKQKIQALVGQVKLEKLTSKDTTTSIQDYIPQAKAFTGLFQEFLTFSDPEISFKTYIKQFALFMEEIDPKLYLSALNYSILYSYEQISSDSDFVGYDLSPEVFNPEEFISLYYPEEFTSLYIEETIKVLEAFPADKKPDYLIHILKNIPNHLLQSIKTEEE